MVVHNMLSICVLIAALATGDCFLSNLLNEPLNFAVSVLDGQAQSEARYPTTEYGPHTPEPITVTGHADTTFTATPGGQSNLKQVIAHKLATYIGGASTKSKVQHVQASRHNSGVSSIHSSSSSTEIKAAPSSDESSSKTTWKRVRPAPKRPSNKAYNNQRIKASISTGRRHPSHGRINARQSPSKAGHKYRQSGWRKSSWGANRSSGSGEKYPVLNAKPVKGVGSGSSSSEENVVIVQKTAKPPSRLRGSSTKYPVVTAKHARGVGSSSSSEENIIIIHRTAKPANKLRGSSKKSVWKKNRWASNRSSGSGEKYPVVNAKPVKGVGSSSSSSEENVIIVQKTAKPANRWRGSSKKSDWKKNRWASNRSSGSGEKYPVVNAKPVKGVGSSSSSSSEENVIIVQKTAKPANRWRGSSKKSGWKNNKWASNRSSGSGEKYPVVNAKPVKGVGSGSSSSEENVIIVENMQPAHSYRALKSDSYSGYSNRAADGYASKRRYSPKLPPATLCKLCRG